MTMPPPIGTYGVHPANVPMRASATTENMIAFPTLSVTARADLAATFVVFGRISSGSQKGLKLSFVAANAAAGVSCECQVAVDRVDRK